MRIFNAAQLATMRPDLADAIRKRAVAADNFIVPGKLQAELEAEFGPLPAMSAPPIAKQIKSAAITLGGVIRGVPRGHFKRAEADVARILAICKACEFCDLVKEKCTKCNCFLQVKLPLAASKCPIDKW